MPCLYGPFIRRRVCTAKADRPAWRASGSAVGVPNTRRRVCVCVCMLPGSMTFRGVLVGRRGRWWDENDHKIAKGVKPVQITRARARTHTRNYSYTQTKLLLHTYKTTLTRTQTYPYTCTKVPLHTDACAHHYTTSARRWHSKSVRRRHRPPRRVSRAKCIGTDSYPVSGFLCHPCPGGWRSRLSTGAGIMAGCRSGNNNTVINSVTVGAPSGYNCVWYVFFSTRDGFYVNARSLGDRRFVCYGETSMWMLKNVNYRDVSAIGGNIVDNRKK